MNRGIVLMIAAWLWVVLPARSAWAHAGGLGDGIDDPLVAGFVHPILGLDHLLAMVSVGVISAMIGGRAIWLVPLTFLGAMAGGALAAQSFLLVTPSVVEGAIAASVVLLGIAIALERQIPIQITFGFVAFFGFFHGFAHGVETPAWANPVAFGIGFLLGSTLIHLQGVLIGGIAMRFPSWQPVVRVAGAGFVLIGVLTLTGLV